MHYLSDFVPMKLPWRSQEGRTATHFVLLVFLREMKIIQKYYLAKKQMREMTNTSTWPRLQTVKICQKTDLNIFRVEKQRYWMYPCFFKVGIWQLGQKAVDDYFVNIFYTCVHFFVFGDDFIPAYSYKSLHRKTMYQSNVLFPAFSTPSNESIVCFQRLVVAAPVLAKRQPRGCTKMKEGEKEVVPNQVSGGAYCSPRGTVRNL